MGTQPTYIITSAPDAYDYATARTVAVLPEQFGHYFEGRRLVQVDPSADAVYQSNRYLSGAYFSTILPSSIGMDNNQEGT